MQVFGVTITGVHPQMALHRFYGLASDAESAIALATGQAKRDGWESPRVADVSLLGDLEFGEQHVGCDVSHQQHVGCDVSHQQLGMNHEHDASGHIGR